MNTVYVALLIAPIPAIALIRAMQFGVVSETSSQKSLRTQPLGRQNSSSPAAPLDARSTPSIFLPLPRTRPAIATQSSIARDRGGMNRRAGDTVACSLQIKLPNGECSLRIVIFLNVLGRKENTLGMTSIGNYIVTKAAKSN